MNYYSNGNRYFCCPFCGMKFTMGRTWKSNTSHHCTGLDNQAISIANPYILKWKVDEYYDRPILEIEE